MTGTASVDPDLHRAARLVALTMQGRGDEAVLMLELVPDDELRTLIRYVLATAAITVEAVAGELPAAAQLREQLAVFSERL